MRFRDVQLLLRYMAVLLVPLAGLCRAQLTGQADITKKVIAPVTGRLQVERVSIRGGAELLVLMKESPSLAREEEQGGTLPLVAILRDTLGDDDPTDDRLRFVWSLTSSRPSIWQRVASVLPFFYWRVRGPGRSARINPPVIDLQQAHRPLVTATAAAIGQKLLLDSQGTLIRSSSRALRGNVSDNRQTHVIAALTALSENEGEPSVRRALSPAELQQIQARLLLARNPLGGLVSDTRLTEVYERRRLDTESSRGHNWEVLRQRAEAENLVFEPLRDRDGGARFALVSIDKRDLGAERIFSRRFLNFRDPWSDSRLKEWKGFLLRGELGERIPLGLYSLDYPHVPLLVVDFRDSWAPRRKEMFQRTVTDVTDGVLGLTYLSNWYYFAGRTAYDFVRGRQGAARDRAARARAYEELRVSLMLDDQWDASLKYEVRKRLRMNSVNPLNTNSPVEIANARLQFQKLSAAAADPKGLSARLDRDRRAEMTVLVHGQAARGWLKTANLLSVGLYTHRERSTPELLVKLGQKRRIDTQKEYLREALASSPELDVTEDLNAMGIAVHSVGEAHLDPDVPILLSSVFQKTRDAVLRQKCLTALQQLGTRSAQQQIDTLKALLDTGMPAVGGASTWSGSGSPASPLRGQ